MTSVFLVSQKVSSTAGYLNVIKKIDKRIKNEENCFLLLLSILIFSCGNDDQTSDAESDNPKWINSLIKEIQNERVANPPAKIIRYSYNGNIVYFVPEKCCDVMSILYDTSGNKICHPNGGYDGGGDGKCSDFFSTKSGEAVIWEDPRSGN